MLNRKNLKDVLVVCGYPGYNSEIIATKSLSSKNMRKIWKNKITLYLHLPHGLYSPLNFRAPLDDDLVFFGMRVKVS